MEAGKYLGALLNHGLGWLDPDVYSLLLWPGRAGSSGEKAASPGGEVKGGEAVAILGVDAIAIRARKQGPERGGVAVVGRQVHRRPAASVAQQRVRAAVEQQLPQWGEYTRGSSVRCLVTDDAHIATVSGKPSEAGEQLVGRVVETVDILPGARSCTAGGGRRAVW